ncbi:dioxygenase [Pseudomonas fluorescens]|uniref:dioxygenase family protein n=1 Tax=Pseudomonas fluorescens TaxID=294 RepID=UPI001913B0B6|nr:dioxygenase [Pseudomonas fluorescens]
MAKFDENALTQAVIDSLGPDADPRVRQISASLIRHLHAFIRDIEPTQEEWQDAIDFLTRTGQTCTPVRQEFILLSDALGASMLVDAINHRLPSKATHSTVLGPFFVSDAPRVPSGAMISRPEDGPPLRIEGSVASVTGEPLQGAVVEIWHCDESGFYDVQKDPQTLNGRASVVTDAQGRFMVRSVVPSFYPIPDDGPVGDMLHAQGRHPFRPAHVHFKISAQGYRSLTTHLFPAADPYLNSDVVFGVKDSLIVELTHAEQTTVLQHDFTLAAN